MKVKLNLKKFSKEDLQKIVLECFDKTELANRLGYTYFNGKVSKKITELVQNNGISIDHFDPSKKVKARRKYPIIEKICPVCGKKFETKQGHLKESATCSSSCSNIFFAAKKHSPDQRLKASHSLIEFYSSSAISDLIDGDVLFRLTCQKCAKMFHSVKSTTMCCSMSCAAQLRAENPETRKKLSVAMQSRIASGAHKGWPTRIKLEPSYAEKYVITLLQELNITMERELKIGKWFIDFADPSRKLALEIDGRQHELPDRKLSDEKKDQYLVAAGWQVLRIKWKKITKEFREEIIESISKFLIRA